MAQTQRCSHKRCAKENSKVFKYQGENRSGQRVELSSKWCEKHACQALVRSATSEATTTSQWVLCSATSKKDSHYCETHLQCYRSDCTRRRVNGNRPQDPPLCRTHKCTQRNCYSEASGPSNRCQDHWDECHVPLPGCRNKVVEYGQYCEHHTCKEKGCLNQNFGRWCLDHKPCDAANCFKECAIVRTDPGRARRQAHCQDHLLVPCGACRANNKSTIAPLGEIFCDAHQCRERGCHLQRAHKDSSDILPMKYKEYCETHNCHDPECQLPISQLSSRETAASEYCQMHECECTKPPCRKRREPEKPYCTEHTCEHAGCREMRSQDPKLNSQKRCFDHDKEKEEFRNEKRESAKKRADEDKRKKNEEEDTKKAQTLRKIEELEVKIKEREEKIAKLEMDGAKEQMKRRKELEDQAKEESAKKKAQEEAEKKQIFEKNKQLETDVARLKEQLKKKDEEGKGRASDVTRQSKPQEERTEWEQYLYDQNVTLLVKIKELENRLSDQQMRQGFDQNANFRHMTGGAGGPRPSESGYGSANYPVLPLEIPRNIKKFNMELADAK